MDPRWARVKSIFEDARTRETADQARILKENCGTDIPLREEVEALIAADRQAGDDFLKGSAAASLWVERDFDAEAVPERLGVWRTIRTLGQGGMSSVHLVERAD